MFDGDTGNFVGLQSIESTKEIDRYLKTRSAWVMQDGRLRAPLDYDTVDLIVRNLTGRFDHVRNITKKTLKN